MGPDLVRRREAAARLRAPRREALLVVQVSPLLFYPNGSDGYVKNRQNNGLIKPFRRRRAAAERGRRGARARPRPPRGRRRRRRAGRRGGRRGRRPPRRRARPRHAATAASTASSPTFCAHAPDAGVEQRRDVGALRPLARALGDRPPERGREARDGAGVAGGAGGPHAHEERVAVAVVAELLDRERVAGRRALVPELLRASGSRTTPRPSRACSRCASSSIHASISTRPSRRPGRSRRAAQAASRSGTPSVAQLVAERRRAAPGPRAGSTRAAPPAPPRAPRRRAARRPAPPEAITGTDTASRDARASARGRSRRASRRRRSTSARISPGAPRLALLRPLDRVARRLASSRRACGRARPSASIATHDRLRAERSASSRDQRGPRERGAVDRDLVGARRAAAPRRRPPSGCRRRP